MVFGLELAKDLEAESVECRTDSQLVVGQMKGDFQIKDDQLLQYFHKATNLTQQFKTIKVTHIPQEENTGAYILSKLSKGKDSRQLTTTNHEQTNHRLHVGVSGTRMGRLEV